MKTTWAVLWDLDGVLVSTLEFHYLAWVKTFDERGIRFTREQFLLTFGMNNTGVLSTILCGTPDPDLLAEISTAKESVFRAAVKGHARPLPGVPQWLDRLQSWRVAQAIASSAPLANIDALVDELGIRSYFAAIVSGAELPGKPNPDVFLKAARLSGVSPERCVVIEDAVAGVEAAKRAGMKCIAVTTTNPADALTEADVVVERLDDLATDVFTRLLMEV